MSLTRFVLQICVYFNFHPLEKRNTHRKRGALHNKSALDGNRMKCNAAVVFGIPTTVPSPLQQPNQSLKYAAPV